MNAGIIAARYAKALLRYVMETGNGGRVYSQAGILVLRMEGIRQLRDYLQENNGLSLQQKADLLAAALGEPLSKELGDFLRLVVQRGRCGYFLRMLYSFISQYQQISDIKVGRLVTALPAEELKATLEDIFGKRTGSQVKLEVKVDPAIIGGFIFELDGYRVDASVEHQFRRIRNTLIDNKNRIV